MIKAELSYNPYLAETYIKFNGKPPRINSLVEKYQDTMFHSWVNKIPLIFHDEMNGYGFNLEFSGTALDYMELKKAFSDAKVSENDVYLFHKNELDSREIKIQAIDQLLQWLNENPNKYFDYPTFREENENLFDSAYPLILINGDPLDLNKLEHLCVAIENVNDISDLNNTDLSLTPILFYLDEKTFLKLPQNMRYLSARKDVSEHQIFYYIAPSLDRVKVERTIKDLEVHSPQIVTAIDDESIKKYLEVYPITDYIYHVIKIFREKTNQITEIVTIAREKSELANLEVYSKIHTLETEIEKIKESINFFLNLDNLDIPQEWQNYKYNLIDDILHWKKRRVKMTEEDALKISVEFDEKLHNWFDHFQQRIAKSMNAQKDSLKKMLSDLYFIAEQDMEYIVPITHKQLPAYDLEPIAKDLMTLKKEDFVYPKEDLFGKLFNKNTTQEVREAILEVTYLYQTWRQYAISGIEPLLDEIINGQFEILNEYSDQLAKGFQNHLEELLNLKNKEKELVAKQLSAEEMQLQADSDWLVCFCDQLQAIERG